MSSVGNIRAAVESYVPASAIISSVAGHFCSATSNDVVTAAANVITLNTWVPATPSVTDSNSSTSGAPSHVLKARFEASLPGRIVALDKLQLPGAAGNNSPHLLVALYSETQLAVMRWCDREHTFRNVALFAMSVEAVDGAVPVVEGITAERSVGLPPLLRVEAAHGLVVVLAQRRYAHFVQLLSTRGAAAGGGDGDGAAAAAAAGAQSTATAKPAAAQQQKQQAVWADEDDDDDNDDDGANTNNNNNNKQDDSGEQKQQATDAEEGVEDSDFCSSNKIAFSRPRTVNLLAHIKSARNIRDVRFVEGFHEPTLAILKESQCTWAGRVKLMTSGSSVIRALSCGLVIATIDITAAQRQIKLLGEENASINNKNDGTAQQAEDAPAADHFVVVRELDGLPYSTTQIHSLPSKRLGGVVCFSANSVIHVAHRGTPFAAMLNKHAHSEKQADHNNTIRWATMEWDESVVVPGTNSSSNNNNDGGDTFPLNHDKTFAEVSVVALSEYSFFVSHGDGTCDVLELGTNDNRSVTAMRCCSVSSFKGAAATLSLLENGNNNNSITSNKHHSLFLGSRVHDSFVLQLEQRGGVAAAASYRCQVAATLRGLAPVVDTDVADIVSPDNALLAEMARHAREQASKQQQLQAAAAESGGGAENNNNAAVIEQDPFADLIGDAPVPRALPKNLTARIRSSALVAACGALQHGSLNVLRRHVTLDVAHRTNIDCSGVFALRGRASAATSAAAHPKRLRDGSVGVSSPASSLAHTVVLLLSGTSSTVAISTLGGRLTQIASDKAGFFCRARTIAALEMGCSAADDYFLQVTANSVHVVKFSAADNGGTLSEVATTSSAPAAVFTHVVLVSDFAALALTETGALHSITFDPESSALTVDDGSATSDKAVLLAAIPGTSSVVIGTAHGDAKLLHLQQQGTASLSITATVVLPGFFSEFPTNINATGSAASHTATTTTPAASSSVNFAEEVLVARLHGHKHSVADDHFTLVVRRTTGEVDAYGMHLSFAAVGDAASASSVGVLRAARLWRSASLLHDVERGETIEKMETIAEKRRKREVEQAAAAAAAAAAAGKEEGGGSAEEVASEDKKATPPEPATQQKQEQTAKPGGATTGHIPGCNRLCYLPNVGGETDAIFVAGSTAAQLLISDRGLLRPHCIRCPDKSGNGLRHFVRCAAPINFSAISNGFVACEFGSVIFSRVQGEESSLCFDLRAPWPVRRVHLHGTPHHVVYSASHSTCVAVTSTPAPFRPTKPPYDLALRSSTAPGAAAAAMDIEHEPIAADEGVPIPKQRRFRLQSFSVGNGWAPGGSFELLENEVVLCATNCLLNQSKTNTLRPRLTIDADAAEFVVVGTSFPLGDDTPCRGRVLVFGTALRGGERRLKLVHAENTKGPVSAVASVGGLVVAAVGASVRIFALDPTGGPTGSPALVTCGFLPSATYVTCITPYKNFIAIGDIFQSVSFASLRAAGGVVSHHTTTPVAIDSGAGQERIVMLAQDRIPREVTATGFVATALPSSSSSSEANHQSGLMPNNHTLPDSQLGILASDARDNLLVMQYEPPSAAQQAALNVRGAIASTTLNPVQHFKMSGAVAKFMRLRTPNETHTGFTADCASLYATLDGEIGFVVPLVEREARVLRWATTQHTTEVESVGGLNVDCERAGRVSETVRLQPAQTMVDLGHVRASFLAAGNALRRTVAKRSGSTVDKITSMLSRSSDTFVEPLF